MLRQVRRQAEVEALPRPGVLARELEERRHERAVRRRETAGVEADGPPVAADGEGAGPDELARREAFDEAVTDNLELVHAADGHSMRRRRHL